MICYRDMTFCTFYETCADAEGCSRALTPEVIKAAEAWWDGDGGLPIATFMSKPRCYVELTVKESDDA